MSLTERIAELKLAAERQRERAEAWAQWRGFCSIWGMVGLTEQSKSWSPEQLGYALVGLMSRVASLEIALVALNGGPDE